MTNFVYLFCKVQKAAYCESPFLMSVMCSTNQCNNQDFEFLLTGFPGLQDTQKWLSIPFFFMFLVSLFGNITILLIISNEQSLREPMYCLISFLLAVDFITSVALLPQLLVTLWFGALTVHFNTCFVQIFFISFNGVLESTVLALMAYDRYVAVCNPLRYSSIVTKKFIVKGLLFSAVRSLCSVLPAQIFANMLPFCSNGTVSNIYCEYFAVINVASTHTYITDVFSYLTVFLVGAPDVTMIALSYYMILRSVLKLKSKEARKKAFSTCSSHVLVIATFYFSAALATLEPIFQNKAPEYVHVMLSVLYVVTPPVLNPIIYGIKSNHIWQVLLKHLRKNNNISLRNKTNYPY
ncbi:olfactory receptor 52E8-like [Protopterus annectens]|uniref:olfactory receptor 52E8-like n=1 Tax=Protopterus annectens TaxID=7888 RepID=UPI001CF95064|nr:olfactory receptor 52E8-like [Protopterus annectens]